MSGTEEDVRYAREFLAELPLSELLDTLAFATARDREATSSARSTLCSEILRHLREILGECAVCGAIGSHGKDYDQFTADEKLAHQVEADAQHR